MSTRGVALGGAKVVVNHKMVVNDCVPVIDLAKFLPEVTKVVIGEASPVRAGKRRIKAVPIHTGLKVTVRGPNMQQTLLVCTSDPEKVERALDALWTQQLR